MKIIDFTRKGNVVKFYLGNDDCEDYWGDDWDDVPYEHNAGAVYDEYVTSACEVAFSTRFVVMEPQNDWHNSGNSTWSKGDMKKRIIPCIIAVLVDELDDDWQYEDCFDTFAATEDNDRIIKFYFGDNMSPGEFSVYR